MLLLLASLLLGCGRIEVARGGHFGLLGQHAELGCADCHGEAPGPLPSSCDGCHEAQRPAVHLPGDCAPCHTEAGWQGGRLAHASFPLTGGHRDLACAACHLSEPWGRDPACEACHEADRPSPHDPASCVGCHGIDSWLDVDHDFFPLVGGHAISCGACHADGYEGADPTCASCHAGDLPPGHFQGGCGACHPVSSWREGRFEHSMFPLQDAHRAPYCAECHAAKDWSTFLCAQCHEHRQEESDDEHGDVPAYRWTTEGCLECHPSGESAED